MTKAINLTQGKIAIIDNRDFDKIKGFKYHAAYRSGLWYAERTDNTSKTTSSLHIDILGRKAGKEIDHKDGNGLNCTRANMRFCTHAQNGRNRKRQHNTKSQYKGIIQSRKKWRASICVGKKIINLGTVDSEKEAAILYNKAAKKYHRQFARLNVID